MALHGTVSAYVPGKEDWTVYVERLNYYFQANDITDAGKKKSIFLSACGESTYKLIRSLVTKAQLDEKTYVQLVALVTKHYAPTPSKIVQRYKFNTRARKSGETIADYVAALREVAEHCGYGESLSDMLRDRLVCGVRHDGIVKRLLAEKDLTYEKAYELATTIEAAERDSKSISTKSEGAANPDGINYTAVRKPKKPTTGLACHRCGVVGHLANNCKHKETTCHRCKKVGHLARVCNTKMKDKVQPAQRQEPKKKAHYLQATEQNTESEDEYSMFHLNSSAQDAITVELTLNGVTTKMIVDTGASLSLINKETYLKIASSSASRSPLQKTEVTLRTYTGEALKLLGCLPVAVVLEETQKELVVYVVEGAGPNLMGRDWISQLEVSVPNVNNLIVGSKLEEMLQKHEEVFSEELGTLKGYKANLQIDPEAKPKFCKARTVPWAMKEAVEKELDRLEGEGIISPVKFADWAAPIVPVMKPNGTVRICGDYKQTVNPVLQVDSYPLPRVDEMFASLAGGQHFTKLDLSQAYLQMELKEEAKKYVTINTHRGLYQYNRLPFGVASAPTIFQRCMETLLKDCKGVTVYIDDVLVTGRTEEEHLKNLDHVLGVFATAGLRLKRPKCSFLKPSVTYLGHVIDKDGIHPTAEKVEAIQEAPSPTNVTELRAFLGILNYYAKFLPNLSSQLAPLYMLLQKKTPWVWSTAQEKAFQTAKEALQANTLLVHYDTEKPLILACDASPYGLGAVLSHVMEDGLERPVAYASRTLSAAERNYSQLDREGLAIVFGVKRFHNYLYGRKFIVESDHQPLSYLFSDQRGVPPQASARIQRWALTLSAYQYSIRYKMGKSLGNADALSRLPKGRSTTTDRTPGELIHLVNHLESTCVDAASLKRATEVDPVLSQVREFLKKGWPTRDLDDKFKPYKNRERELSLLNGCVLWGSRVVIPHMCRQAVLDELHETHPGISKMKMLARSYLWWPNLDADIEQLVKSCSSCQSFKPAPPVAGLHPWEWPEEPWSRLHLDFAGPFMNHMFLLIIDAHSKWLEVKVMKSITSEKTIERLREVFATHGLPKKIVTDNGPSFVSEEFNAFLKKNGISHVTSSPYHPSTNGQVERAVQTMKRALKQMESGTVEEKLCKFLLTYRITPHSTTGVPPCELLMGRRLRSKFDLLHPELASEVQRKQLKQKSYHDKKRKDREFNLGDHVYVEDFTSASERWIPGIVRRRTGPLSYHVELNNGHLVRRHVDNIRSRLAVTRPTETRPSDVGVEWECLPAATPAPVSDARESTESNETQTRRSSRYRRPPERYEDLSSLPN